MSDAFVLEAEIRSDLGKGSSRRLRRLQDKVPAILYGGEKDPVALTLSRKDLAKSLENEAFFSQILTIKVEDLEQKAVLKDLQRHPAKDTVMHADFMRVMADVAITVRVPIHFTNEDKCHGVKMEGGVINHSMTDVEITCLPADLPEYIELDMTDIVVGQIVHISELKLPEGVESVALSHGEEYDLPVASIQMPREEVAEDEELEAVAGEEVAGDTEEAADDAAEDEGESEA